MSVLGVGTTLPFIQWVLRALSSGLKQVGHETDYCLPLPPGLRINGAVPLVALYAFMS